MVIRFTTKIHQQLQKKGYRLFVAQNFLSNSQKILLNPFKSSNKAVAYLKAIPAGRNAHLYHKFSVIENLTKRIALIFCYVQMPDKA